MLVYSFLAYESHNNKCFNTGRNVGGHPRMPLWVPKIDHMPKGWTYHDLDAFDYKKAHDYQRATRTMLRTCMPQTKSHIRT